MPIIDDKNETEEEDMEQDTPESGKSDDDSESASGSEDDESSELDEEECIRRRQNCIEDMTILERQFSILKQQLYVERMAQVTMKLEEMVGGRALEYLTPLKQLQENMQIRTQVSGILRELRIVNVRNKQDAERQAAEQNFESEKALLYDMVKHDLEDKIRRLEEDRHNIDISSDLWNESQANQKKKKRGTGAGDRKKKPITVSGPYIVYMLRDAEIIEDWTAIKKALKQAQRKPSTEQNFFAARYEDGKLFYEGEWYGRGNRIIIDNKEDSPVHATITAINTGEVWVKRSDGNKSKLYIAQLQKGKYTVRHMSGF